jgi:hypothetical protein
MMVKSGLDFFYFEIHQAPSEMPANLPGQFSLSGQIFFLHWAAATLKGLGEFQNKQDSKEWSPRSLDKMLLKRQVNSQNVQSTQSSKLFKYSKSSKFFKSYCMIFKHV